MADSIKLMAGNKEGMPRLPDRVPAFCRDEMAIYIGTPSGNRMLCKAETLEDVETLMRALESLSADDVTFSDGETFQQKYDAGKLTGPPGPQGEQGIPGEPGAAGEPGTNGADGKSAYEYAQDGGYTGTEAEFSALLGGMESLSDAVGTQAEQLQELSEEMSGKLTATAAAEQADIPADADSAAIISAFNSLIAALKLSGIMSETTDEVN